MDGQEGQWQVSFMVLLDLVKERLFSMSFVTGEKLIVVELSSQYDLRIPNKIR